MSSDDVEPEFVPAIGLVVLDADVVAAAGEGREVQRGFVRGPVVDDERSVYPNTDAVVAQRA